MKNAITLTYDNKGKPVVLMSQRDYTDTLKELKTLQNLSQALAGRNVTLSLENDQLRRKLKMTALKLKDYTTLEYQ
jgi:regulator of replication initiation timing